MAGASTTARHSGPYLVATEGRPVQALHRIRHQPTVRRERVTDELRCPNDGYERLADGTCPFCSDDGGRRERLVRRAREYAALLRRRSVAPHTESLAKLLDELAGAIG